LLKKTQATINFVSVILHNGSGACSDATNTTGVSRAIR
jgi:hypothetical protein